MSERKPTPATDPAIDAADSRRYFDEIAGEWDQVRTELFGDNVREKAVSAANLSAGALAADIGAGSGFLTEALLAAGARVIAVDRSGPMLEAMRGKFAGKPVELRAGDTEALPLADGEVAAALANMVIHHVERPAVAVAEMARALKPGGRLVITDMDHHGLDWLAAQYHDRWPGFHRADVRGWLEAAGLREVRVIDADECCTGHIEAEGKRTGETVTVTMFLATGVK